MLPPNPVWDVLLQAKVETWERLYCTLFHEVIPITRSMTLEVTEELFSMLKESGRVEVFDSRGLASATPRAGAEEQQAFGKLALLRTIDMAFQIAHSELVLLEDVPRYLGS